MSRLRLDEDAYLLTTASECNYAIYVRMPANMHLERRRDCLFPLERRRRAFS